MADRYHVNKKGEAGKCRAEQGPCPYGSSDEHYSSAAEAQAAYEEAMGDATVPGPLSNASDEAARRARLLLGGLDSAYRRAQRAKNEETVLELEAAAEEIADQHKLRLAARAE